MRIVFTTCCFLFVIVLSISSALAQPPSLVGVDQIQQENLTQTIPILGRIVAKRSGNVASRISSAVDKVHVDVGDSVKTGQVIASLNSEITRANVNLAESELLDARAELEKEQAESQLAKVALRRQKGLEKSAAFSQARFEDAEKKLLVALAKVKQAEAKISVRQAALERAKINLSYTKIKAPYSGVVIQRFTENGAYLNNGDPVVRLLSAENMEIEADVPYSRISGLSKGRKIKLILDSNKVFMASVRALIPSENPLTRTRIVRLVPKLNQAKVQLAEGQSVTINIPVGAKRKIITVHKDAILKRGSADLVFLVVGGKAEMRKVTLGEAVGQRLEVLNGLKVGDQVVVRGNERLREGAKIRIDASAS